MKKATRKQSDAKAKKFFYFMSKKVGQAIGDYKMLSDGDRILVAVSGGKDSLTLLKLLKFRQTFVPIKFDITVAHIDMGYSPAHSRLLKKFLEKEGINYHIKKVKLPKGNKGEQKNCFWCSWNRRKALFELAARLGYNKVALGHHFDDIIETILLNLFYQGQISAMKPKQELFDGRITIIRPLAYVEENDIIKLTKLWDDFSHPQCSCPQARDSKRTTVEKVIKQLSRECPHVKRNIFESVKRIKKEYLL